MAQQPLEATTRPTPKPAAAPAAPSFTITSVRTKTKYLKLLAYGDYGVGKTFLAATAAEIPTMHDVLLISAESGDLTLQNADPKYNFGDIDEIQCNDFRTVASAYEFLKAHCTYRDVETEEAVIKLKEMQSRVTGVAVEDIKTPKRYQTVIIDSLTEVEAYHMNQLLGISDASRLDAEVDSAEWSEYKKNHSKMQRFARNFRNLPMHVIFTCASQYSQDEQKKFHHTLMLTGKLAKQLQGFMDMVGYLVMNTSGDGDDLKVSRRLYVQPVGRFSAKSRFSNFKAAYFENPTIKSILQGVGMLDKDGKPAEAPLNP